MEIREIGLFEAKTKLSELTRRVAAGESFVITVRGRRIATLMPAPEIAAEQQARAQEAAKIRQMRDQARGAPVETYRGHSIDVWESDGGWQGQIDGVLTMRHTTMDGALQEARAWIDAKRDRPQQA